MYRSKYKFDLFCSLNFLGSFLNRLFFWSIGKNIKFVFIIFKFRKIIKIFCYFVFFGKVVF